MIFGEECPPNWNFACFYLVFETLKCRFVFDETAIITSGDGVGVGKRMVVVVHTRTTIVKFNHIKRTETI